MASSPESATYVGFPGYDMKWTDQSLAAIAERKRLAPRALNVLSTIDREALNESDRISYDLFKRQAVEAVEGTRFPQELLQITQLSGVQQDAAQLFSAMPGNTVPQLENQLSRLETLPTLIDQ